MKASMRVEVLHGTVHPRSTTRRVSITHGEVLMTTRIAILLYRAAFGSGLISSDSRVPRFACKDGEAGILDPALGSFRAEGIARSNTCSRDALVSWGVT